MPLLGCLAPGTRVEIIKKFSWGPWLLTGAQHFESSLEGSTHFMGGLQYCYARSEKLFCDDNYDGFSHLSASYFHENSFH
jgi:hypothetical protein